MDSKGTVSELKQEAISVYDFRDTLGRYRTKSLFLERKGASKYPSYFTLADEDRDGHISVRRLYMQLADPTEFAVGNVLVGDYSHWQTLCELEWFKPYVEKWRMELRMRMDSESISALKDIRDDIKSGSRVQAARLLLARPWEEKSPLRGRPSKVEVDAYKKDLASNIEQSEADYDRMFLAEKK